MAVYLVEDKDGNKTLVETRTKAGAINYVSKDEYKATSLNTSELVKHIKSGMEVQTIGDEEAETTGEIYGKSAPVEALKAAKKAA